MSKTPPTAPAVIVAGAAPAADVAITSSRIANNVIISFIAAKRIKLVSISPGLSATKRVCVGNIGLKSGLLLSYAGVWLRTY